MKEKDGLKIEIDWACDIILGDLSNHAKYEYLKLYNPMSGLDEIK
jgi:hypothetical protein